MLTTKQNQLPAVPMSTTSGSFWAGWENMDRMFDHLFHGFDRSLPVDGWKAPLAVGEDQEHYYVEVELPGVPQDAVEVTVQNRQLLISYERRIPEGRQFLYNERLYGCCERRLALPASVSVEAIKAEMRDGLLHITLDKVPEAQPRTIAIESR